LADDKRDEETRMRDVQGDTNPSNEQPTTVNRQQDTPPAGYEIQNDDQDTEQHTVQSDVPPPPPPPPPPGYGDETQVGREAYGDETQVGRDTYGDETQVGRTVSDETRVGQTMEQDTQVGDRDATRASAQDDRAATTQAAVQSEPAPPSGDEDDEYRWHTDRTARSESAEKDAVEFIDVKKSFGRNTILNGLNLGIPDDQISMILGPSGTGKSVCIKHMVGLLYPDEGDVLVHGESVPNMADDELFEMRKKFGVLFQDGALFGSMNLWDNVAFPLRQHTDKGEDEIQDIVNRRLKEVGLGGAGDKMPNELSGGMRKRAGFARALVLDPRIVLFDEPDSGLDPVRTALLCELIQEIHEENGGAYVVITHDIMSARRVAEYIAILWKGRIVESGPAEELFNSDNQFVRQFLSGEARGPLGME
jgi:phospholipid/cholesterol/gamma-HCH transport system ATP-binding protein